jgi:DNA-binding NtrC family response regulator
MASEVVPVSGSEAGAVAVFDDDLRFLRMVERALESHGLHMQPVTTPDLDDAVRVVALSDARAALIDIYMYGEAAGFDVIDRLRHNPETAGIPIIVTSGAYRDINKHRDFLRENNCSVLPKPFEVDQLLTTVDSALVAGKVPAQIIDMAERRLADSEPGILSLFRKNYVEV